MGQMAYIAASDDAARGLDDENKYKFCDDLTILELVSIGSLLAEYDVRSHVASDVGTEQRFLDPALLQTQSHISDLEIWTRQNKMRLNARKTSYIIFNRARESFETRLTVEGEWMERKKSLKLLGVWLDEDGGWNKNTQELCKRAYSRLSMLSKLRYAGVSIEDSSLQDAHTELSRILCSRLP